MIKTKNPLRKVWRQYRRTEMPDMFEQSLTSFVKPLNRPERHLVSVGVGKPYEEAARRLERQAKATGWFDHIHIVNGREDVLGSEAILQTLEPLKRLYQKGAGLWAWKAALVRRALQTAPQGAHVYYIDAGCELSTYGSARFEYLDGILAAQSALLFHLPFLEEDWTKPALLERFPNARGRNQLQATWFAFKNDSIGIAISKRWLELCYENNFEWLLDPDPSDFCPVIEHRHDQSVLSCLIKGEFDFIKSMPWEDFYAPWMYHVDSDVLLAPIHALRTRDGGSILAPLLRESTLQQCMSMLPKGNWHLRLILKRVSRRVRFLLQDELVILLDTLGRIRKNRSVRVPSIGRDIP